MVQLLEMAVAAQAAHGGLVRHRDGRAARLAQRVEDEKVSDGLRHSQT
jgi:hypothetical protein